MARTPANPRWQRVQTLPKAAPPSGATPIYEQLVREWGAAGRALPGGGGQEVERARAPRFPQQPESRAPAPPRRGWLHPT
ncbi:hypothetical protein [Streptomyces sp. NPDC047315]|uniref:hypothetical protein n=1 Tax=Streptomyces sp. NPDC047315 TaxID=3155142 RepID=UPI0033F02F93